MVVVHYVQGIPERITRSLKKRKISVAARLHLTLRNILVHPKDKVDPREGVYTIPCKNCPKQDIGETKRKLGVRLKEHKEEVEKIAGKRVYTRDSRKQSE